MLLDVNCDLGEGCPHDAELMRLITSANVACGFHAGGPAEASVALELAVKHGVRVGAHPSFPDREGFGRRELQRTDRQIYEDCVYQIGALAGLARPHGIALTHVKPHGALYNMACRDKAIARPVVDAASLFELAVLGLPGSQLEAACVGRCRFVAEGFADRRYRDDGSLIPRTEANALVVSTVAAVQQVLWLVKEKGIQTLCIHGDNPQALDFVRQMRLTLKEFDIDVRAFA